MFTDDNDGIRTQRQKGSLEVYADVKLNSALLNDNGQKDKSQEEIRIHVEMNKNKTTKHQNLQGVVKQCALFIVVNAYIKKEETF